VQEHITLINKEFNNFLKERQLVEWFNDPEVYKLFVVDIDGTIAEFPSQLKSLPIINLGKCLNCIYYNNTQCDRKVLCHNADPEMVLKYFNIDKILQFKINEKAWDLLQYISTFRNSGIIIAYVTARPDVLMDNTYKWLKDNSFPSGPLFCVGGSEDPVIRKIAAVAFIMDILDGDRITFILEDDELIRNAYITTFNAVNLFSMIEDSAYGTFGTSRENPDI
jgi:uncharacterized HAD superfamily protein